MTVMPVDGLRNPRDLDLVETPPPPNSKPLPPPLFWAIRSRSHGFLLDLSAPKKGKHSKPLPPPTSKPRPHRHQPQQQQCDVHESSYRQFIEVIERSRNEPAPEERSAVAGQRHASARQQQVRIDARRSALDRGQRRQMAGVTCVTTEHTKTKKKKQQRKRSISCRSRSSVEARRILIGRPSATNRMPIFFSTKNHAGPWTLYDHNAIPRPSKWNTIAFQVVPTTIREPSIGRFFSAPRVASLGQSEGLNTSRDLFSSSNRTGTKFAIHPHR